MAVAFLAACRDNPPPPVPERTSAAPVPKAPAGDTTPIVATVDSFAITAGMVEERMGAHERYLAGKVLRQDTDIEALRMQERRRIVGELLLRHLLELETSRRGLRIPAAKADSAAAVRIRLLHPDSTQRERFLHTRSMELDDLKLSVLADLEAEALAEAIHPDSMRASEQELRAYYEANKANMRIPETLEEMRTARRRELTGHCTDALLRSAKVTFLDTTYKDDALFHEW